MSQNVEIEFKNLLSEKEFYQLQKVFQLTEAQFKIQTNYYFDTPNFVLKKHNAALRIREKNSSYELTLKEPLGQGLLETTDVLEKQIASSLIDGKQNLPMGDVHSQLDKYSIDLNELTCFGFLKTERAEIDYQNGLLVFDKSTYFEKEDFELEYEVLDIDAGKKAFEELLKTYDIPIRPADNKILRFYREKLRNEAKDSR
ncbi:CYTH domain-containing protein [Bacillus carboniphilus]|uniref:CYTH domain-containing protein n=1 Tax=Bacillus carboniphilus TaxID=86663 RepID=A0ABP3FTD2_9BACI